MYGREISKKEDIYVSAGIKVEKGLRRVGMGAGGCIITQQTKKKVKKRYILMGEQDIIVVKAKHARWEHEFKDGAATI